MAHRQATIYVGNLPSNITEKSLEEIFLKYGNIQSMRMKFKKGSTYAFIEFDSRRTAKNVINSRHICKLDGHELLVNFDLKRRSTHYPVLVENLPESTTWRDLRRHMADAGRVLFVIFGCDQTATVDFESKADRDRVIRRKNRTLLRTMNGTASIIRIKAVPGTERILPRTRSKSDEIPQHPRSRSPSTADRYNFLRSPSNSPQSSKTSDQSRDSLPVFLKTESRPPIYYCTNGYRSPSVSPSPQKFKRMESPGQPLQPQLGRSRFEQFFGVELSI